MMAETRCPYCGASEDANGPRLTFECGTGGSCEGSAIRTAPCYLREINGLKAENERLRADVERLYQEVGKLMADKSHLMMFLGYAVTCRQHNRAKWMQRFTANLNECLEAIGDTDRAYWKEYADVIVVYNPHEKEE